MADDDEVEFEPETFVVGPYEFEVTTVAHLPIEKLMSNHAKGVEISGQKVWCGSLSVCELIMKDSGLVKDRMIVELGAGTGVLGMVCSKLGCRKLIVTDNDPQSITHMKADLPRNGISADVEILDWFKPGEIQFVRDAIAHDSSLRLTVVAGDVLYKRMLLEPFFSTVRLLLGFQERSDMYLCHVPRAGVEQSDVMSTARSLGLSIDPLPEELWRNEEVLQYCPEEDVSRAAVYKIALHST
jgi:predicted nicotinamide N-methyase